MIKSYIKIALRYLFKNRVYSIINLFGLAIGMTCCFLIMMWVTDELSWNKFHVNADSIFRVEQDQPTPQGPFHVNVTPYAMGPVLKDEIPEIKNTTRIAFPGTLLVRAGENVFYEDNACCVDPSYLEMFTYPLVKGNAKSQLNDPSSIVITEEIAEKYFGKEDPIGKNILINNKYSFTVTGVIENIPLNSSLRRNILLPFSFEKTRGINVENWLSNEIVTCVQLHNQTKKDEVNTKISELTRQHSTAQIQSIPGNANGQANLVPFKLNRITDLRLYGKFGYGQAPGIQSILIFSFLAFFVLLIACINFMSLSTAQSAKRAKEVGLRKVSGAMRSLLAKQFYSESILMTLFAAIVAIGLVILLIPAFNSMTGKSFSLMTPFQSNNLPVLFIVVLLTGIVSGTYPAIFLSSLKPIQVLKGKFQSSGKGSVLRKILVVFQFALSVILIIGTIVLSKQLDYMRNKNVGYDKEQLIYLPLRGATQTSYASLKDELKKDPMVLGVSGTWQQPTSMSANANSADWEGRDPNFDPLINLALVDYDYTETFKIPIIEGRSFSKNFASDSINGVLVNESLIKLTGIQSPIGKRFTWQGITGTILGVMKDYHYSNIQLGIEPLAVYILSPKAMNYAIVRLQAGNISGSLERVKAGWQKVNPLYPFDYKFFDEDFAQMFQADERMAALFKYASIFAIVVACLGLFGLALYMAEQRTQEIGVRKVMGSTIVEVNTLLSKEFIKWILIANLIAWPAAYFILGRILENYAYRVPFTWWIYPLALILSVGVAILTVSWQSWRAATRNPVEALRYE